MYLVVFGSVIVFVLSLFVIQRWTASASAYSFVLMPIVTITVEAWLEHEPIRLALVLGGVLVLVGVYIGGMASSFSRRSHLVSQPGEAAD